VILGEREKNIETIMDMTERLAGDATVHWSPTLYSASNGGLADFHLVGEDVVAIPGGLVDYISAIGY
jgi:hypothetical protein